MAKPSLIIIIMECFICIGILSFMCKQHITLENRLINDNIRLINECGKL